MDNQQFHDEMFRKLQDLDDRLKGQVFAPPSTEDASRQQEERKRVVAQVRARISEARLKLEEFHGNIDTALPPAQEDINRRWQDILELNKKPR